MNLKQLEVFVAVAETGSFSKGAEAAFITQSTVSQHIGALEGEFGIKLLDRTGRGALPTEGGKVLLRHARQLLCGAREVVEAMARFRGLDDATLSIGGSNIPGNYLIPAALPKLLKRFPGLKLTLLQGDSRDILTRIVSQEVEVGIVGSQFGEEGCTFIPICRDDIRLVVGQGHPWHGRKSVRLQELQEVEIILRESGSGTGDTVLEALLKAGLSLQDLTVRARLGSNEAVKHAVAASVGVSFLSLISVQKEVERGEIVPIAVEGLEISREFYLASRTGRELSPAAAAFAGVMLEIDKGTGEPPEVTVTP